MADLVHPHALHALTALWSLRSALAVLDDAIRAAAEERTHDDGIRSPSVGTRHPSGLPSDPVAAAALLSGGLGGGIGDPYERLRNAIAGTIRWLAGRAAPGPGDPLGRLIAAASTLPPAAAGHIAAWTAECDGRIRRALYLPPDEQALPGNPPCPACRVRLLRVRTSAPDRSAWTAMCGGRCICTGQGCTCGMPVLAAGSEHIWRRADLYAALRTARRRPA